MCDQKICVVLIPAAPAQQAAVAEALDAELKKRAAGGACIITAADVQPSAQEAARAVIRALEERNIIPAASDAPVYSEADEEKIRKRLEHLGYL